MNLPKTLVVCGQNVKIQYRKKLFYEGCECWGLYDADKHIIYLKMGMEKTRKLEIVIHEMIHCIASIHTFALTEKAVKILGVEILAAIRNNKLRLL